MNDCSPPSPRILVAGLGNIFLGDDAFGVEVARRLLETPPHRNVRVVDFGIAGVDLVYSLLDGYDLVILIDAVARGGQPGTLYVIEPETPGSGRCDEHASLMLDPHDMDPAKVLRLVSSMGGHVGRVLLLGCEPARSDEPTPDEQTEMGLDSQAQAGALGEADGLSEPVKAAVNRAVELARRLIADAQATERIFVKEPINEDAAISG